MFQFLKSNACLVFRSICIPNLPFSFHCNTGSWPGRHGGPSSSHMPTGSSSVFCLYFSHAYKKCSYFLKRLHKVLLDFIFQV
uniref:Uncharacterized protein n=1 Tax=Setaria italica TaxID=4555 RepID=K4AHE7_SETIT